MILTRSVLALAGCAPRAASGHALDPASGRHGDSLARCSSWPRHQKAGANVVTIPGAGDGRGVTTTTLNRIGDGLADLVRRARHQKEL